MNNRSRKLLKHIVFNFLRWPSTLIPVLALIILLVSLVDSSKYGNINAREQFLIWWAFDPQNPIRQAGLPILFSFLAHKDFLHYLINIPFIFVLCSVMQKQLGVYKTWLIIFLSQILTNIFIWSLFKIIPRQGELFYFMGSSGVALTLFGFISLTQYRVLLPATIVLLIYFIINSFTTNLAGINPLAHLFALLLGLSFGLVFFLSARRAGEKVLPHH